MDFTVIRAHRVSINPTIYISSTDFFYADMKISLIVLLCVCWAGVSATHQKLKNENVKVNLYVYMLA